MMLSTLYTEAKYVDYYESLFVLNVLHIMVYLNISMAISQKN